MTVNLNEDWLGCNPTRFKVGRDGLKIVGVVCHSMAGTWQSANALFQSDGGGNPTSAHLGVPLDEIENLKRWVKKEDTAYADGNWTENETFLSIEGEDNGDGAAPRPDSFYARYAAIVAREAAENGFEINRKNVIRHDEVPGASTSCPVALDVDRIVREALAIANPTTKGELMANYSKEKVSDESVYGEGFQGAPSGYQPRDLWVAGRSLTAGTIKVVFNDQTAEVPVAAGGRFAVKAPGDGVWDVEVHGSGMLFVARIYEDTRV